MKYLINERFRDLMPKLCKAEYSQLEENLIENGCMDSVCVWNNTIIDGHNRVEICERKGIEFEVDDNFEFENEDEVCMWIIKNQIGKRNLSKYDKSVLVLKGLEYLKVVAKENQVQGLRVGTETPVSATLHTRENIDITAKAAEIADVSRRTVAKVSVIEEKATPEEKADLSSGKTTINKVYNKVKETIEKEVVKLNLRDLVKNLCVRLKRNLKH